ncbi:MAG: TonB-dependent receptor [Bacteroidales bacterium]|nr:TonB-dependent receptor [Bacteroidales bacterium]
MNLQVSFKSLSMCKTLVALAVIVSVSFGAAISANASVVRAENSTQSSQIMAAGIVLDTQGQPIVGASVIEQGTRNGVVTDSDGKFIISVKSGAQIEVSCIGFATKVVSASSKMTVILEEDSQFLEEAVVVGYGIQKKANLTGAVSSVDVAKTIESRPIADIGRALQGAVPGLTVTTGSGEIGGAPSIKIRGSISSPNGSGNPLILVDNVEIDDISLVNPDDIESISVLKDAASSSIYGARAAFGVLLITTKAKSKAEKITVKYSGSISLRTPTKTPEQLPGWQQGEINLIGAKNAAADPNSVSYYNIVGNMRVDQTSIDKMKSYWEAYGFGDQFGSEMVEGRDFEFRDGGMFFIRTWDWYDMYIRKWALQHNHSLSVNGGNGRTNYNIAFGYLKQDGQMKINSDTFDRYNANLSLNSQLTKWLSVRGGVMFTRANYSKPMTYNSDLYDPMYYLYRWQAMYPYGTYNGYEFRSGITETKYAPRTTNETEYVRLNGGLTIKPIDDLSIDVDGSYTSKNRFGKKYGDIKGVSTINVFTAMNSVAAFVPVNYISSSYDYVQETSTRNQSLVLNAVATYKHTWGDHGFSAMAGTNIEKSETKYFLAKRMGLLDASKPELNLATGNQTTESSHSWWAVAGFFGRINYSYKDRYLLEVNGRYDGSSKFPSGSRFAFFPSVSAGWRVTEEPWMQNQSVASTLKIRGSFGMIGNQDVGNDRFVSTLSTGTDSWIINGEKVQSTSKPTIVSSALSWEKVTTLDFGFDYRVFNDALGVTFDWYRRTTSDILTAANLPSTLGAAAPYENTGAIQTNGWELAVDFHREFSNGFYLNVMASLSDYRTVVTKWTTNTAIPTYSSGSGWWSTTYYKEGMVLGDIWGLTFDRFLTANDFNADGSLKDGIPDQTKVFKSGHRFAPGDVLFKDLDNNGEISMQSGTDKKGDYSVIGNALPRLQYGFNIDLAWKGFDLNLFFQGVGKKDLWAAGNQVLPGFTSGEPYYVGAEDYWSETNQDAFYPRPYTYGQSTSGNYTINNRYMLNMSYLRLKTLTFGYTLPKKVGDAIHLSKARVYFTGENLLTIDKVKAAIDPEIAVRTANGASDQRNFGRSYPFAKVLSFGLQLTF